MEEAAPRETPKSGRTVRWSLLGSLVVVAVAIGLIAFSKSSRRLSSSDSEADLFPLPPISQSPFLNANHKVEYVGSDACRECHSEHDAAFQHTSMGRSMSTIDLSREPPDGAFDHPLSKRRYEV